MSKQALLALLPELVCLWCTWTWIHTTCDGDAPALSLAIGKTFGHEFID